MASFTDDPLVSLYQNRSLIKFHDNARKIYFYKHTKIFHRMIKFFMLINYHNLIRIKYVVETQLDTHIHRDYENISSSNFILFTQKPFMGWNEPFIWRPFYDHHHRSAVNYPSIWYISRTCLHFLENRGDLFCKYQHNDDNSLKSNSWNKFFLHQTLWGGKFLSSTCFQFKFNSMV